MKTVEVAPPTERKPASRRPATEAPRVIKFQSDEEWAELESERQAAQYRKELIAEIHGHLPYVGDALLRLVCAALRQGKVIETLYQGLNRVEAAAAVITKEEEKRKPGPYAK